MYKLIPLTLSIEGFYTLSQLRKEKILSNTQLFLNYNPYETMVNTGNGLEKMTIWGHGLDCWYLVEFML